MAFQFFSRSPVLLRHSPSKHRCSPTFPSRRETWFLRQRHVAPNDSQWCCSRCLWHTKTMRKNSSVVWARNRPTGIGPKNTPTATTHWSFSEEWRSKSVDNLPSAESSRRLGDKCREQLGEPSKEPFLKQAPFLKQLLFAPKNPRRQSQRCWGRIWQDGKMRKCCENMGRQWKTWQDYFGEMMNDFGKVRTTQN